MEARFREIADFVDGRGPAADPTSDSASSTQRFDDAFVAGFVHRLRATHDTFDPGNATLADVLRDAATLPVRTLFFVDDGVLATHDGLAARIEAYVEAHRDVFNLAGPVVPVPGGERCKNELPILESLLREIDRGKLCRKSYVIAVGGGAVLDAVGFAAATAHRGVQLIRLPTTTLGQCDSGVGVKNGVNFFGKKNWLGSFAVPTAVINDSGFLGTLSDRDWRSGFSEAVKVALIKDRDLFERLVADRSAVVRRDVARSMPLLLRSAELHMRHITSNGDPFERTTARPLDFGHWSAHKLEQMTRFGLRHGEAVAIGVALDVVYGALTGFVRWETADRVLDCLRGLGFETYDPALGQAETLLDGLEEFRQHLGGRLTLTLIDEIGSAIEVHEMDAGAIREAIAHLAKGATRQAIG